MFAIPWGLILRIAAIIALIAAVIGGIKYVVHSIQSQGRQLERQEWLDKQVKDQEAQAVAFGDAVKRVQQYRDEQEKNLMEVLNVKDKSIAKLEKAERAALAANRGLYVHAGACSSPDAGKGETAGAGIVSVGAGRIRLSGEDESNIRADYGLAQRVVIQYNACREKLKSLVDVVSDDNGGNKAFSD